LIGDMDHLPAEIYPMDQHNKSFKERTWRRMRAFLIVSGLVLPAGITTPANAAGFDCGPRDMLTTQLRADFSEHPSGVGVTSAGTLLELWKTKGGETWTVVLSLPDGNSCIGGSGNDWIPITPNGASSVAHRPNEMPPKTHIEILSRPK
jgi:hypothetical protein